MSAFRRKLMQLHKFSAFFFAVLYMVTKMQKVLALSDMPFIKKKRHGTIKDRVRMLKEFKRNQKRKKKCYEIIK